MTARKQGKSREIIAFTEGKSLSEIEKERRRKTAVSKSAAGSRVRCSRNDHYDVFPVAAGIASVNR